MSYDYRDHMFDDIKEALRDYPREKGESLDDYRERVYEALWIDDSVTGNASGSYTFNTYRAAEYIGDNPDLVREVADEWELSRDTLLSPEALDVSIRCYLLGEVLDEVLGL